MNDDDVNGARRARPVGRPPISASEPSYQVTTRLPENVHERLMTLANQSGQPVAAVLRNIVVVHLKS